MNKVPGIRTQNMGKLKKTLTILAAAAVLVFILAPNKFPDNADFVAQLNEITPKRVIIVFNSGGWGYTPPQEANDFKSILSGIQETFEKMDYNPIVIPYKRTENSFLGKITGLKSLLSSFYSQSSALAEQLELHLVKNPEERIIITGLSNGAAFSNQIIEKIPQAEGSKILAVEVGTPFWEKPLQADNVLFLDNNGQDSLADRKVSNLLISLIKAPFRVISAKLCGTNISFARSIQVPGHEYTWESLTGRQISQFLRENFDSSQ